MRVTIVGMIYRSVRYLDFMMYNIKKYCLPCTQHNVDYLIVGNDPTHAVREKLERDNINHLIRIDSKPNDYYMNRVYRGWNFGGFNAPGDVIVFINSDDGLSPGWLENLLKHLDDVNIPCSRLIESNKMASGQHAAKAEFGRNPAEFNEEGWLQYVAKHSENCTKPGGLYMPCAIHKKEFVEWGGYPEGNIYEGGVGAYGTRLLYAGDDYFFHYDPRLKHKKHITVFDSLVYHIIEGEKDE